MAIKLELAWWDIYRWGRKGIYRACLAMQQDRENQQGYPNRGPGIEDHFYGSVAEGVVHLHTGKKWTPIVRDGKFPVDVGDVEVRAIFRRPEDRLIVQPKDIRHRPGCRFILVDCTPIHLEGEPVAFLLGWCTAAEATVLGEEHTYRPNGTAHYVDPKKLHDMRGLT